MRARLLVIMGPSGCGKSTIGALLAEELGCPFLEGDDFHPVANVHKMALAQPLTDKDREAWLDAIGVALVGHTGAADIVLSCSALTPFVQSRLRAMPGFDIRFFLLEASKDLLVARLNARSDHFMPPALIDSQCDALSPPKDATTLDARLSVDEIVANIAAALRKDA